MRAAMQGSSDHSARRMSRYSTDYPAATDLQKSAFVRARLPQLRGTAFGGKGPQVIADPARQERIDHPRPLEALLVDQVERVGVFDVGWAPSDLDPVLAPGDREPAARREEPAPVVGRQAEAAHGPLDRARGVFPGVDADHHDHGALGGRNLLQARGKRTTLERTLLMAAGIHEGQDHGPAAQPAES